MHRLNRKYVIVDCFFWIFSNAFKNKNKYIDNVHRSPFGIKALSSMRKLAKEADPLWM